MSTNLRHFIAGNSLRGFCMFGKILFNTMEHFWECIPDVLTCVNVVFWIFVFVVQPTGGITLAAHLTRLASCNTLGSLSHVQRKKSQLNLRHLKSSSGFFMHAPQVSLSLSSGSAPRFLSALPLLLRCALLFSSLVYVHLLYPRSFLWTRKAE